MPPALSDYGSDLEDYDLNTSLPADDGDSNVNTSGAVDDHDVHPQAVSIDSSVNPPPQLSPPLALSAQGSQQSSAIYTDRTHSVASRTPASRPKKRSALLAGLSMDNVMSSDDENQVLSGSRELGHTTRRQTRGARRSEIVYDQRYHPMDDVLAPRRAARVRSRYQGGNDVSDGSSDAAESNHSQSVPDIEETPSVFRRSTRPYRARRFALYRQDVHPQDEQLQTILNSEDGRRSARISVEGSSSDEYDGENHVLNEIDSMVDGSQDGMDMSVVGQDENHENIRTDVGNHGFFNTENYGLANHENQHLASFENNGFVNDEVYGFAGFENTDENQESPTDEDVGFFDGNHSRVLQVGQQVGLLVHRQVGHQAGPQVGPQVDRQVTQVNEPHLPLGFVQGVGVAASNPRVFGDQQDRIKNSFPRTPGAPFQIYVESLAEQHVNFMRHANEARPAPHLQDFEASKENHDPSPLPVEGFLPMTLGDVTNLPPRRRRLRQVEGPLTPLSCSDSNESVDGNEGLDMDEMY